VPPAAGSAPSVRAPAGEDFSRHFGVGGGGSEDRGGDLPGSCGGEGKGGGAAARGSGIACRVSRASAGSRGVTAAQSVPGSASVFGCWRVPSA